MERLDVQEISHAEDVMTKFSHRTEEVVNLMFGDHYKIITHGDTYLTDNILTGEKYVKHYYWDGYDAEPFDNCSVEFPFDWINMTFEELKEIKPKYWEDMQKSRKKMAEEINRVQQEMDEQKEREEYERLRAKFENK